MTEVRSWNGGAKNLDLFKLSQKKQEWEYSYDAQERIQTVTDGTNNVIGHRWMAPDSFTSTYDDDGNLTNDGRWENTWNAERCDLIGSIIDGGHKPVARREKHAMPRMLNQNRLIKMETTAAARTAGVPWTVIDCVYDYRGRRISRKQTDKDSGGTVTGTSENHYRYDGWNCIARTNTGWSEAIYYTWGTDLSGTMQGAGGVGGLLGVKQETATTTHRSSPCFDGNGNVVAYVDTGGNILTRYEYDPFGKLIRSDGAVNSEKELYLFSTKPIDVASGLYYYGYRYYDPVTGRWPSRDPIGEAGGMNLYGFVGNDGINWTDLLGNKVYICKPNAKAYESMLKKAGVKFSPGEESRIYKNVIEYNEANFLQKGGRNEILGSMINSGRKFRIRDEIRMKAHVDARLKVIDIAKKAKCKFGVGSKSYRDPEYWVKDSNMDSGWKLKPGLNITQRRKAYEGLFNNSETHMGCLAATKNVYILGDAKSRFIYKEDGVYMRGKGGIIEDWVPGDWGGIRNTKHDPKSDPLGAQYGENIIYLGSSKYWGLYPGLKIRSLKEWVTEVRSWNGGAKLGPKRWGPSIGRTRYAKDMLKW